MSKPKKRPEGYPRKRVLIPLTDEADEDRRGRDWGHAITAPDFNALQVVLASQNSAWANETDYPGLMAALREQASAVVAGDLTRAEAMLTNQAVALESLFSRLTIKALEQTHMPNIEGFMRLALRAQNQCRATLETLAVLKNPPVVYARQANVAVGGPQQVNNHAGPAQAGGESRPTQLLRPNDEPWLDTGAQGAPGRTDPQLAPVGEIHRTDNGRG